MKKIYSLEDLAKMDLAEAEKRFIAQPGSMEVELSPAGDTNAREAWKALTYHKRYGSKFGDKR